LKFLRDLSKLIADRAAVYLAVALHALWVVRTEAETACSSSSSSEAAVGNHHQVTIACNGTIVEKYPGFRAACQGFLDRLCHLSSSSSSSSSSLPASSPRDGRTQDRQDLDTLDGVVGHADDAADAEPYGAGSVTKRRAVTLEMAPESSIFGAAVAVSCLRDTA
ncbi:hypothetical protein KC336_g22043, partial [Hortaea werneckii]